MIIVSQDKMKHVPYERYPLLIIEVSENKMVTIAQETSYGPLHIAWYSSKEKALKVMDMIRKHYAFEEISKRVKIDFVLSIDGRFKGFKMPLDEEVEV